MTDLPSEPAKKNNGSIPILVADDLYENRYLLEVTLKAEGYQVITASNGQEALDYLHAHPVRLIISDILMPKMDGFQLCREVRKDPELKKIPLIFYTASYTSEKDRDFGLNLGADRYFLKPKDTDEFLTEIEGLLAESEGIISSEPALPSESEDEYLREYSERIFQKLEKKIRQLEQSQQSLQESENKFRTLFETANDAIYLHEMTPQGPGRILLANAAASMMLGYTNEEFLERTVTDLNDPDYDVPLPSLFEEIKKEPKKTFEWAHRTKDGRILPVEISVTVFESRGRTMAVANVRDISDRKKAEAELNQALAERGALLSEIHHRVNNNLQVLLSMLTLEEISYQDKLAADSFAANLLSDTENRIRAIAMVHENLYQSGELTGIRLHEHLSLLAQEILTSEIGRVYITYTVEGGEDVVVPMDKAVLLSLVASEILTNIQKYAVPDGEEGRVTILIHEEPDHLCLDIGDDGVGLPAGMNLSTTESVGLSIIYHVVTVQLGGTVELRAGKGTTYHICIPGSYRS